MSKANPRKAVRALLPESKSGDGWTVRPLTLATYAILERIKSPLLGVVPADGVLSLVPSLYVLTHDPLDSLSGDLFGKSVKWADSLPPAALVAIRDACDAQIRAMIDVVPEVPQDDSKKKDTTDGSPSLPNGPARPTAGRGAKPSSRPRRASSRSSGGSAAQPTEPTTSSRSR